MRHHVRQLCQSAGFHLWSTGGIRHLLDATTARRSWSMPTSHLVSILEVFIPMESQNRCWLSCSTYRILQLGSSQKLSNMNTSIRSSSVCTGPLSSTGLIRVSASHLSGSTWPSTCLPVVPHLALPTRQVFAIQQLDASVAVSGRVEGLSMVIALVRVLHLIPGIPCLCRLRILWTHFSVFKSQLKTHLFKMVFD